MEQINSYPKIYSQEMEARSADNSKTKDFDIFKLRFKAEYIVFNGLNIFDTLLDNFFEEDAFFYFDLAFKSLEHKSFNLKNCGLSILNSIIQKIETLYKSTLKFFEFEKEIRVKISEYLLKAIQTEAKISIFCILTIFKKLEYLQAKELELIAECTKFGDLIALYARDILRTIAGKNPRNANEFQEAQKQTLVFPKNIKECEIINRLLNILSGNEQHKISAAYVYIEAKYGIKKVSKEYLRHELIGIAVEKGYKDSLIKILNEKIKFCEETEDFTFSDHKYDLEILKQASI